MAFRVITGFPAAIVSRELKPNLPKFGWPNAAHYALIQEYLGDQLIGHVSTAVEAREKPPAKTDEESSAEEAAKAAAKAVPCRRGRPRRGEVRPPKPETRIEKQQNMTLAQMIADLPKTCDIGSKRDSQGFKHSWRGYKLHIDTADGDIPVNAILTSAFRA